MVRLNNKLPASSLVEVTVGMVLISLVIGFALMIYTNVLRSSSPLQRLKYQLTLQDMARQTVRQQTFSNETTTHETVAIHKTVNPYPDTEGGWLIQLEAIGPDQTIITQYQTVAYDPSY